MEARRVKRASHVTCLMSTPLNPPPPRWKPNPDPSSIEIPGLDTTASPHDQIEQIEQLITLKLQNIDENFSKIHHILTSRILPALKRYSAGTQPVREAAKFWVEFYEAAAQIRIPTYDDYETVNEEPSERSEQTESREESQEESHEESETEVHEPSQAEKHERSVAPSDSSFMPEQAAFASTPAARRIASTQGSFATQQFDTTESSWSASMESPLVKLDREIKDFTEEEESDTGLSSTPSKLAKTPFNSLTSDPSQSRSIRATDKGKEKEQSLLRSVFRQNLYSHHDNSSLPPGVSTSPLRPKSKLNTPVPPKESNPYIPPNSKPKDWNGLVDLRHTPISTPGHRSLRPGSHRKPATPAGVDIDWDDDDSFGLPPGMSPPKFMSPARPPPKASSSTAAGAGVGVGVGLKLGQSPAKSAAARITRDLLRDAQMRSAGKLGVPSREESTFSTTISSPDLSRYTKRNVINDNSVATSTDTSLELMMQQIGLRGPPVTSQHPVQPDTRPYEWSSAGESESDVGGPSSHYYARYATQGADNVDQHQHPHPLGPQEDSFQGELNDDLDDDDSDSFDDEINNTAHPSAAFLMASQNRRNMNMDNSFDSESSMDSMDMDMNMGQGDPDVSGDLELPVHPFARMAALGLGLSQGGVDDSFDDDDSFNNGGVEEETLFGVPPGQREAIASGNRDLVLHGGSLFDDGSGLTEDINQVDFVSRKAYNSESYKCIGLPCTDYQPHLLAMLSLFAKGSPAHFNDNHLPQNQNADKRTIIVKPSSKLNLPTPDPIPLNVMDLIMPPLFLRFVMMYKLRNEDPDTDAGGEKAFDKVVQLLISSLADALELYPPVAGRLRPVNPEKGSELAIFCDGTGAEVVVHRENRPFVEEEHDLQSLSFGPLFLPLDEVAKKGSLMVKVTKFSCGTVTIVPQLHHYVTDLGSYMDFVSTWAKIANGESIDMTLFPKSWVHEPMKYFSSKQIDPSLVPTSVPGIVVRPEDAPPLPFPKIRDTLRWYFSDTALEQLKVDCTSILNLNPSNNTSSAAWISTADAFTALVWAAQTRARYAVDPNLVADKTQTLGVAVDARERLKALGLPHHYFGNFNLSLAVSASRKDLLDASLEATTRVALAIRTGLLEHLTFDAMAYRMAFLEAQALALEGQVGHRLMLEGDNRSTNWSKYDLTKMLFGPRLEPVYTNVGTKSSFPAGSMFIWKAKGGVIVASPVDSKEADDILLADKLMVKYGTVVQ
ncbi:hypothetical protein D9758_007153 [Tetrapyrgos nigripes]|uniref:Outer kinetochore protein ASK1 n=1 Tax=Tetrapyrgos nigripes TaxID=182062 RepID=A0A8H5GDG4_9AGAR|nr:hypothetical protein D9758_007153 [Tetrapyrgos nigripes]